MKKETVGKALGLSIERDNEIAALVVRIVSKSQKKSEVIERLEKQGLERKELFLAAFYAGIYWETTNRTFIPKLQEEITLLELENQFWCDTCPNKGDCPEEEKTRAEYKKIKKEIQDTEEKTKNKERFKVKVE